MRRIKSNLVSSRLGNTSGLVASRGLCLSACYVLNRVPHKKLDKTPYELWKGHSPNLSVMKVWGCLAKVGIPTHKRPKIGPKTVDSIFVGYAHNSAAYRFLVKNDDGTYTNGSIAESRDAEFFEHIYPMKHVVPSSDEVIDSCVDTSSNETMEHVSEDNEVRRSKRARVEKDFGPDFVTSYLVDNEVMDFVNALVMEDDPQTYDQAMKSVDAVFWKEAIQSELDSIMGNNTWVLVDLPRGCKPLRSKWIFKKKLKVDGTVDKFKARLVAMGNTQKKGLDYFDSYSPVTKFATIRVLFALASIHKLLVHQMDVKTAFLHGDLEEEIYMKQPEGCAKPGQEHKVCKLVRSLYGLKQAPKQWNQKFDTTIIEFGFQVSEADSCLYTKKDQSGCVILSLYVDDMLIFGTSMEVVNKTKEFLSSKFDMKDMGEAEFILGVKIIRTSKGIALSQSHYVEKVLKKFGEYECSPVSTPFDPLVHLQKSSSTQDPCDQEEYAKVIGSVMFLMSCTRPDIAYAVSRLSRYTHCPNASHWIAIRRLLRYLKGTMDWGLHFCGTPSVLEGFSDANWVTDNDEINSTSGYIFTLGGGAVSWKSRKQSCTASSTMESEFIALELAGNEAEWMRHLLADIPLWGKPAPSVALHCDNQAAIAVAINGVYNGKRRHIRLRHKIVRELITTGVISLDFVKSEKNIADPLTKGLSKRVVHETALEMGLKSLV